jgi:signal transduction histidine kinase
MNSPFLCGMLAAWVVAQVGLGAFFALAFALTRREAEYLLFALLCFALAITSAGVSWGYGARTVEQWLMASIVSHGGAILSAGLNLHFVVRYSGARVGRPALGVAYVLVGFYEAANALGYWWESDRVSALESRVLGFSVQHTTADPGAIAMSFYVIGAAVLLLSVGLLARSRRPGRRESLVAMVGGSVLALAGVNDIFLMTRVIQDTVYLLPHAFLIYAFGMASNLILRYQATAGELHETASSLAQATEELRHSHAELLQVQSELVSTQQLAAVGELAAAIAHEVRNPLAIIVNAVAGLRRSGLREEDRTMLLGIVDEETARLNRLVTDLLRFARPVNVKRSLVSFAELAHRSESLVKEGHNIQVSVADDPIVQGVEVDPGLMRLVFDNLVENACQAMPAGGTVKIEVDRALHSAALISVAIKDSGHGMDADVLQRATHPFFTTRPSGTGLGLPIVQRIVEAHGGRIEIESEPGQGTCVRVLLPLRPPEIQDGAYEAEIRSQQKSA